MNERFIGREDEVRRLEYAWNSGEFEFVVVYGRRRVGKSFLIENFIKDKQGVYFEAVQKSNVNNLILLSRAVSASLYGNDSLSYSSFIDIFDDIAKRAEKERFYFVLDEIAYLSESFPDIIGLLQHYVDIVFRKTKLMLILSGSSRRFIEEKILSSESPLYDRRTLLIKLLPFSTFETAKMFPSWSIKDISIAHVITGGIPYYQNFLKRHKNINDAIYSEFFLPGSSLFTEARLFLMSEYRSVGAYEAVLSQLADGVTDVSKIRDKTGYSDSNVSQMLSSLSYQGITEKRHKILNRGNNKGWKIRDGYFAFFYHFVFPYASLIERNKGLAPFNKAISSMDAFIGKQMENSFHDYVLTNSGLLITDIGSIDFANPLTRQNEEVDLFGKAGDTYILGECKWLNEKVSSSVFYRLEDRAGQLIGKEEKVKYFILSLSGFEEELLKLSEKRSDLTLITGSSLFGHSERA